MTQQQANDKDVFELSRGELNSVLGYLGKRPAEEVYGLVSLLLSKGPARLALVEEAPVATQEVAVTEIPEEAKTTEQ